MRCRAILVSIIAILVAAGCANLDRRDEPFTQAVNVDKPHIAMGQRVFYSTCNQCHPGGNAGYGPSITGKFFPALYIELRVRNGLGGMPAFDEKRITSEQLEAVVDYVQALHDLR